MCKCTPEIRTPFCGKPGCEWPEQVKKPKKEKPVITAHFYTDDEGDLNIEWAGVKIRFGIYLTPDATEGGWYFISDEIDADGYLPDEFMSRIKMVDGS